MKELSLDSIKIKYLGHAGFKISGKKIIYIDPYDIDETEKADYILITHSHYDHFSPEDVKKIRQESTVIISRSDVANKLEGDVKVVSQGDVLDLDDIKLTAVAAYNVDKEFHKRAFGVGFIVEIDGKRIYHAGDTDYIREMENKKEFGNIDVALLPIGGTYTMDAEQAAKAANTIKPKIAVPMHYGEIVGSKKDANKFKELVDKDIKVEILG